MISEYLFSPKETLKSASREAANGTKETFEDMRFLAVRDRLRQILADVDVSTVLLLRAGQLDGTV